MDVSQNLIARQSAPNVHYLQQQKSRFVPKVLSSKIAEKLQRVPGQGSEGFKRPVLLDQGAKSKVATFFVKSVWGSSQLNQVKLQLVEQIVTEGNAQDIVNHPQNHSKLEVARAGLYLQPPGSDIEPMVIGSQRWDSFRISKETGVEQNSIYTSNELLFGNVDGLSNLFVSLDVGRPPAITSGAIKSMGQLQQFAEMLHFLTENNHVPQLRVSMHQLDLHDVYTETQANEALSYALGLNCDEYRVAISNGIQTNHVGIAVQMQWLKKDLAPMPENPKYQAYCQAQDLIDNTLKQKLELRASFVEKILWIRANEKENEKLKDKYAGVMVQGVYDIDVEKRIELKSKIDEFDATCKVARVLKNKMAKLDRILIGQNQNLYKAMLDLDHPKLVLASKVLAEEYGQKKELNPTQKLACQFLLDLSLNALTQINCKDGVEKTKPARVLYSALMDKIKQDRNLSETISFVLSDQFKDETKGDGILPGPLLFNDSGF